MKTMSHRAMSSCWRGSSSVFFRVRRRCIPRLIGRLINLRLPSGNAGIDRPTDYGVNVTDWGYCAGMWCVMCDQWSIVRYGSCSGVRVLVRVWVLVWVPVRGLALVLELDHWRLAAVQLFDVMLEGLDLVGQLQSFHTSFEKFRGEAAPSAMTDRKPGRVSMGRGKCGMECVVEYGECGVGRIHEINT